MNSKYEIRKRLTILVWIILTTVFFWSMSFLPNKFDLGSFLSYMILLFGGGFAFHFFTEMLSAPANEENWSHWGQLAMYLVKAAGAIFSVFVVAYFEKFVFSFAGLPTVLTVFSAMWYSISQAEKAHDVLYQIKGS